MRVWVAGLTIGGAVNKAQNSTVSAFLYAVSGTSDLLVVPSQYFYFHRKNTDFSGKPLDKRGGVKYINHRMLALLSDEC